MSTYSTRTADRHWNLEYGTWVNVFCSFHHLSLAGCLVFKPFLWWDRESQKLGAHREYVKASVGGPPRPRDRSTVLWGARAELSWCFVSRERGEASGERSGSVWRWKRTSGVDRRRWVTFRSSRKSQTSVCLFLLSEVRFRNMSSGFLLTCVCHSSLSVSMFVDSQLNVVINPFIKANKQTSLKSVFLSLRFKKMNETSGACLTCLHPEKSSKLINYCWTEKFQNVKMCCRFSFVCLCDEDFLF